MTIPGTVDPLAPRARDARRHVGPTARRGARTTLAAATERPRQPRRVGGARVDRRQGGARRR